MWGREKGAGGGEVYGIKGCVLSGGVMCHIRFSTSRTCVDYHVAQVCGWGGVVGRGDAH